MAVLYSRFCMVAVLYSRFCMFYFDFASKGSLGAVVKLLPCDHEVMGSSPGNSLLQKCRERLRTIDPKWSDPSLDPAQAGATCTRLPYFDFASLSMTQTCCFTYISEDIKPLPSY